jgi:hypothetical protein
MLEKRHGGRWTVIATVESAWIVGTLRDAEAVEKSTGAGLVVCTLFALWRNASQREPCATSRADHEESYSRALVVLCIFASGVAEAPRLAEVEIRARGGQQAPVFRIVILPFLTKALNNQLSFLERFGLL